MQDIKLPDSAGGYSYLDDGSCPALANRTLYWRTSHDTLELHEVSLNHNLVGGRVRFRFLDTPLLPGISVHEAWGQVVVLVATVSSVHKLSFSHPSSLEAGQVGQAEGGLMSVLGEASAASAREHQHTLSWPSSTLLPSTACSYFSQEEEAVFVLANTAGQLTCVKLNRVRGMTSVNSLAAPSSVLGRVWSSLTGAQQTADRGDQPSSLAVTALGSLGLVLLAVCRDHKLRAWSLTSYDCLMAADLVTFTAEAGRALNQGAQGHRLALVGGDTRGEVVAALYLCFQQHSQFLLVRVAVSAGQLGLAPQATVYCPDFDLVDFHVSPERAITAVWTTGEGDTVIRRTVAGTQGWQAVSAADCEAVMPEDLELAGGEDPRQTYLTALFTPGAFLASTLAKTVAIFRRSLDREVEGLGWERIKAEVVSAVESEVQSGLDLGDCEVGNCRNLVWK